MDNIEPQVGRFVKTCLWSLIRGNTMVNEVSDG